MPSLFLLRGLSGSGKTTAAKILAGSYDAVISADDYFTTTDSGYEFNRFFLPQAHKSCQDRVESCMRWGVDRIFVANTFSITSELDIYLHLAKIYKYQVFSIIMENRHGGVSQHDVPDEIISSMRERFQIQL